MNYLEDALKQAQAGFNNGLKRNLGEKLISQFSIHDPNNGFACKFTSIGLALSTFTGKSLNLDDFHAACVNNGSIRKDFYILDPNKMALAFGLSGYHWVTEERDIRGFIVKSINDKMPCIVSLGGRHYEPCDGYDFISEKAFTVDDVGSWGDTFIDIETLQMYRLANGKRIYSTHPDGSRRVVTSVGRFDVT